MTKQQVEVLLEQLAARVRAGEPAAIRVLTAFVGPETPGGTARVARMPDPEELAGWLDHTLLRPDATAADVDRLCDEAREHRFASVCVNGAWVERCAQRLAGTDVLVCCVVGFPLGAAVPEVKAFEARRALEDGADEIDMVQNIGALRMGSDLLVQRDIEGVVAVAHTRGARVKVILETCLLSEEEKRRACEIAVRAGADFVKTSTGFSSAGATLEDVALMRATVGGAVGVKASGGIRDRARARNMLAAGATRIGASASVEIARGDPESPRGPKESSSHR